MGGWNISGIDTLITKTAGPWDSDLCLIYSRFLHTREDCTRV